MHLPRLRFPLPSLRLLGGLLLLFLLALWLWRRWQGPEVPVYVVEAGPLVQTVVATGRVVKESRAEIGSEITAVVLERLVREGDELEAGDLLLRLRADDIAAQLREAEAALLQLETVTRPRAELALSRAETELEQARRETARRRDLGARGLLANEALEQAEQAEELARLAAENARLEARGVAAGQAEETGLRARAAALRAQLAKTELRTPVAGTVLTRAVEPGDLVQPGQLLFTLALRGDTEILAPLDEKNLPLLVLSQVAQVVSDAYPQRPFLATLHYIAPSIDPQRGTVDVRLKVDPAPDFLRQDMTVSVNIETGRREQALALPNDALVEQQGERAQVLLLREGRVRRQALSLGLRGLAAAEVLAGLQSGDLVLSDPAGAPEPGSRARARRVSWPPAARGTAAAEAVTQP